jgi:hypothetical protein
MVIIDRILRQLADGELRTLPQLLAEIPELAADPQGAEALRLLLRLDRRLRLLDNEHWTLATGPQTPQQRIVTSAQAYLDRIPAGGALVGSIVSHVTQETNYDRTRVRSVILSCFVNNGQVVRNKLKES